MRASYYFAYGSCMSLKDIQRTTKADFVSAATLFDYRLAFTRYSHGRRGGVADIVESAGDYLEGVVFKVYDLKAMDAREGHPYCYQRRKVKVFMRETQKIKDVWAYEVVHKSEYELQPSAYYCDLIREGARAYLSGYYNHDLEKNLNRFRAPHDIGEDLEWTMFKKGLEERLG